MNDTITTIYYLCDEFLKAIHHRDDPQVRLSTSEVMTVPLVAATFFGAKTSTRAVRSSKSMATCPT